MINEPMIMMHDRIIKCLTEGCW